MNKLVILDRDGVINFDSDDYIKTVDEFIPLSGSIEAIANLAKNGFKVAIATNQSGIGRRFYDLSVLSQIHAKLRGLVAVFGAELGIIKFCPHLPSDNCLCRKPKPQMLLEIIEFYQVKACDVYFVGDSFSDIKAGENAGCKTALVKTGKGFQSLDFYKQQNLNPPICFDDLADFANFLISG